MTGKRQRLRSEDPDPLVARYAEAAAAHGRATDAGDARAANRAHDEIAAIYRELRRRGGDARRCLLPLLLRIEPAVRGWAAAHALEFAPEEGEPVLEALSRGRRGVERLSAEMTLREWRAGRLRFP